MMPTVSAMESVGLNRAFRPTESGHGVRESVRSGQSCMVRSLLGRDSRGRERRCGAALSIFHATSSKTRSRTLTGVHSAQHADGMTWLRTSCSRAGNAHELEDAFNFVMPLRRSRPSRCMCPLLRMQ